MTRHWSLATAMILFATAALPVRGSAQEAGPSPLGLSFGFGVGMSDVRDSRTNEQGTGEAFHLRAGWSLGRGITPTVEVGGHRMSDVVLPTGEATTPHVLKTWSLLASMQVELPHAFYVRPGVGVAGHAFTIPDPDPAAADEEALHVSQESGPAAGLALGRTVIATRVVAIAIEGVALWSQGGEATGTRRTAGIQAVALLRF